MAIKELKALEKVVSNVSRKDEECTIDAGDCITTESHSRKKWKITNEYNLSLSSTSRCEDVKVKFKY